MSKIDIYSAFDETLQMIKNGRSKEECLQKYPEFAKDLNEILDIAMDLDQLKASTPDQSVVLRNKARVLLAASSMRSQDVRRFKKESPSPVFGRLMRLSVTLAMLIGLLVTSGTGLVSAASTSLPGDNLYVVKRGWENVLLAFVFSDDARRELENKFEEERYDEIQELYDEDRFELVTFTGVINEIGPDYIIVGGLKVRIEADEVDISLFKVGDFVTVVGETEDGEIEAEELVPAVMQGLIQPTDTSVPSATASLIATATASATSAVKFQSFGTETESESESEVEDESDDSSETEESHSIETDEPTQKPESTEPKEPTQQPEPTQP